MIRNLDYKWIKLLKLSNNMKVFRTNTYIFSNNINKNFNIFYKYHNFTSYRSEFLILTNTFKIFSNKFSILRYYNLKNINFENKIFFILSTIYRIIFKKGFFLKIIQSINSVLRKINFIFFNSCFSYYISNNFFFKNNNNLELANQDELYTFKYSLLNIFDFYISNEISGSADSKLLTEYDDNILNFSNFENFNNVILNNNSESLINSLLLNSENISNRSIFILNFYFKYFFFCKTSKLSFSSITELNNLDSISKNYFYSLYNKNFKIFSLSMFKKYYLLVINNFKKIYHESYINLLNNFFSIDFIIPKLLSLLNFIFKIQVKSLSKKMKKILKNKRKFTLAYSYIKPHRRLNVLLYFIKKYTLIADGKDFKEKFFNVLISLIFEEKDSWLIQVYKIHQLECISNIKYRGK